jgi:hypothetical protein
MEEEEEQFPEVEGSPVLSTSGGGTIKLLLLPTLPLLLPLMRPLGEEEAIRRD